MEASIIVPFHSNAAHLHLCLVSLANTAKDAEIIVVANNDDPGVFSTLSLPRSVRPIYVEQALGYAAAVNLGAKEATRDLLVFCDADVLAVDGWLAPHLALHSSSRTVGITSSKILDAQTGRIRDFGIGRTFYNHFHPFLDLTPRHELTLLDRRVQMASSACMAIRKELFFTLGMFDERLRHHYQDVDLCLRLKELRRECFVLADSVVYHKGGSTDIARRSMQIDERGYYTAKNQERFEVDFSRYFSLSAESCARGRPFEDQYLLVDISTVLDPESYQEVFTSIFDLADGVRAVPAYRDMDSLPLLEHVGPAVIDAKLPIVFFVDRFVAVRHNALWSSYRDTGRDLVVDRHANLVAFQDCLAPVTGRR